MDDPCRFMESISARAEKSKIIIHKNLMMCDLPFLVLCSKKLFPTIKKNIWLRESIIIHKNIFPPFGDRSI